MSTATVLRGIPTWLLVAIVPVMAVIAVVVTSLVTTDQPSATAGPAAAGPDTVAIKNFSFSPKPITVKTGAAITVVNDDSVTHTLTADNGTFDTGDLGSGRRGSVTVNRAGTYPYHCTIHTFMHGTARVSP